MYEEEEGALGEEEFGNDRGLESEDGLALEEEDSYDPDDRYH